MNLQSSLLYNFLLSMKGNFKRQTLASLFLLLNISLYAQTDSTKKYEFDLSLVSEVNSGNSYVTLGGGLGNIEPLIFEANLIPNFIIRQDKGSKLIGVFTPQIIMRMYQETSSPVKTPSYMPHITIYYSIGEELSIDNFAVFGKIAHHSNGQQGDFYLENGEINYDTGNFSTNYFEIGIIKTFFDNTLNAAQFFSTSFKIHPPSFSNEELDGIYSFYRWNNQFSIFKLPFQNNENGRAKFSFKGEVTWLFGDVYDWGFLSFNRLVGSLTFYYHPPFLEEIGFFAQYYHGQDYYNIYFPKNRDIFRIGIMTDQFRI